MTEPTARPSDVSGEGASANSETRAAPGGEQTSAQAAADPFAEAQREAAEYKDKVLRTLAEMENLRRRTEREVQDARLYAVAAFARDVIAVADNMERAMMALDHEIRAKADSGVKALLDGVELTERELLKVLEKHGIRKFEPKGEKFDPNLHQAMHEIADSSLAPGTVAQVVQAGYMLGERVLRPALVAVAKGQASGKRDDAPANDNTNAA